MKLEIANELMNIVKSNENVLKIFRKTLVRLYRSYRENEIDEGEFQIEYNNLLYKCSLMCV